MIVTEKIASQVEQSNLISRDLSWIKFNHRVLDQARHIDRSIFDRLKFLAITASNLDEFCMIRIGSLYNYIDYGKERIDYSGLRELPFRKLLLEKTRNFTEEQNRYFANKLKPLFQENGFAIRSYLEVGEDDRSQLDDYFHKTIFPMLTPMVFDNYHTFPILSNNRLFFGVVTLAHNDGQDNKKISFIQVPGNLPRFYELEREESIDFVPIEEIIKNNIHQLFRNVEIISSDIFRITRNGDFTLEESEDIETNFLEELKRKLKTRRTGRVVRLEVMGEASPWMISLLKNRWEIDDSNIFSIGNSSLIDFMGLWQIVNHTQFKDKRKLSHGPVAPMNFPEESEDDDILEVLRDRDVLLHHPYNSMEPLLNLLEKSAEDTNVLSIKLTIYRVAKNSRITAALLRAAENGKHVSVLFEVKARFDEENNLREAQRLQKAGCFVIYGISSLKTHTKLLLIVRKEGEKVTRYVHMSTGNYNETTSKLYTDLGILSSKETYANDVSEFFNAITGHSHPAHYENLITSPRDMRDQLINLIEQEANNAGVGQTSGIVIKVNSLQDKKFIEALYKASQSGVPCKLIIRGICCLRPGRSGLSENIEVRSVVGDYLEHSRLYYFHNHGDPLVYSGSADAMVRSFDRRIESLFRILDTNLKQQAINILHYNLLDNVNAYVMHEDGSFHVKETAAEPRFNLHEEFFKVDKEKMMAVSLF